MDHPAAQAQYGLANLASFDLTDGQRILDRAIAQATLVDDKVVSRAAWYFPYVFDFALHGPAAVPSSPLGPYLAQDPRCMRG